MKNLAVGLRGRVGSMGLAVGVGLLACASPAMAAPPPMTTIEFPIDTATIATVVAAAGAVVLLAYFGVKVGFALVKKLLGRLHKSV